MRVIKLITAVLFLIIAFSACQKDFIVKDIENETVTVLSPPDGFNTPNNNITFWWEKIDGAEKYNLQIVSPSFSNIQQLVTDTSITTDKFTKILTPGIYQWRVRATNNGGNTAWTTRTLTIDTSSNLAYSAVVLYSPADSFYTNATSLTLAWYPVNNASVYTLNVTPGLVSNGSYSTTSATINFANEGTYTWLVRAENAFSFTPYSSRKIFIDRTAPSAPALNYPIDEASNIPNDTLLRWTLATGSYKDVVTVSTDNFVNSANTLIAADTVDVSSSGMRTYLFSNFNPVTGTTYYWKVKSIDRAGNVGTFSEIRSFSVQ